MDNKNNNANDYVYSTVIMAVPLRESMWFT